ncbi:hypothetical protein FB481_102251 [Pseudomonas sp. AG1028]|nr:hypothetical protein FB481_102251 [Pseudomonas sp. AG1028]
MVARKKQVTCYQRMGPSCLDPAEAGAEYGAPLGRVMAAGLFGFPQVAHGKAGDPNDMKEKV